MEGVVILHRGYWKRAYPIPPRWDGDVLQEVLRNNGGTSTFQSLLDFTVGAGRTTRGLPPSGTFAPDRS